MYCIGSDSHLLDSLLAAGRLQAAGIFIYMHVVCMYVLVLVREAAFASPPVARIFRGTHREQNCDTIHIISLVASGILEAGELVPDREVQVQALPCGFYSCSGSGEVLLLLNTQLDKSYAQ